MLVRWALVTIVAVLLVIQVALLKEKMKKLSRHARAEMHEIYLRLQREASKIGSVPRSIGDTYEKLKEEFEKSAEWKREEQKKDEQIQAQIATHVVRGLSSGDEWTQAAQKASQNYVQTYLHDWSQNQISQIGQRVIENMSGQSKATDGESVQRKPSSVSVKLGGARNSIGVGPLRVTHEVKTNNSQFELELNKDIRSGMGYQPSSQTMTWSFSAGF